MWDNNISSLEDALLIFRLQNQINVLFWFFKVQYCTFTRRLLLITSRINSIKLVIWISMIKCLQSRAIYCYKRCIMETRFRQFVIIVSIIREFPHRVVHYMSILYKDGRWAFSVAGLMARKVQRWYLRVSPGSNPSYSA